jgi:hypothetical protein
LLPDGKLVHLQGALHHKNLWSMQIDSGVVRQLTDLPNDLGVRDFDISSDGHEAMLERAQSRSHVVSIERTSF